MWAEKQLRFEVASLGFCQDRRDGSARFLLPTPLRQRPLPDAAAHRCAPGGFACPRAPLGLMSVGFLPEASIALVHSWLIAAWWWEES